MIKSTYDAKRNAVIIEFEGHVDASQSEQFLADVQKTLPKAQGFSVLTDLTALEKMDRDVQGTVTEVMDILNAHGVGRVVRVIPDSGKDIGFNILSVFHYSKGVKILTLESREEALKKL